MVIIPYGYEITETYEVILIGKEPLGISDRAFAVDLFWILTLLQMLSTTALRKQ